MTQLIIKTGIGEKMVGRSSAMADQTGIPEGLKELHLSKRFHIIIQKQLLRKAPRLFQYMVPTQVLIVQIFSVMKKVDLINTKSGLILVYASGVSFAVFMYQGFVRSIPIDMEEFQQ